MTVQPIYLLADSQLLFCREPESNLAGRIRAGLVADEPMAAYVGASNGDNPDFYHLFVAAMESIDIRRCRMVPAKPSDEDKAFLQQADLVLLAGGDVERGWQVFEQNGLKDLILYKQYQGSTLVGVSAGAIQLGLGWLTNNARPTAFSTFRLAPFYISAHDEGAEWFDLRVLVNLAPPGICGAGIPAGGGAVYWPDGTLEPVRRQLIELVKSEDRLSESMLIPGKPDLESTGQE